jgi:hypothetical protein
MIARMNAQVGLAYAPVSMQCPPMSGPHCSSARYRSRYGPAGSSAAADCAETAKQKAARSARLDQTGSRQAAANRLAYALPSPLEEDGAPRSPVLRADETRRSSPLQAGS